MKSPIDAICGIESRYYIFKKDKYWRKDVGKKAIGPKAIKGNWGKDGNGELDGSFDAICGIDKKYYIFKGQQYWKKEVGSDHLAGPTDIKGNWGVDEKGNELDGPFDAVCAVDGSRYYFFKGQQYWRKDVGSDKLAGPKPIKGNWSKDENGELDGSFDAVCNIEGNRYYLFKGDLYWRKNVNEDKLIGPKDIESGWGDLNPSPGFTKIRFIGYAMPTTPANLVDIGDPDGPGAVAGTYLGSDDLQTDFQTRIQIMKHAVDIAQKNLPHDEEEVINVFVAPEFYFHGTQGPYVYQDEANDPVVAIQNALAETFPASAYPNWTFVCGSVSTAQIQNLDKVFSANATVTRNKVVKALAEQWTDSYGPLKGVLFDMLVNFIKVCHSYPCCEVRNKSIIVSNIPIRPSVHGDTTNVMTTEKYFISNEDFVLYDPTGNPVITEQMTAYPPLDLSAGDAKQTAFDAFAIFRQDGLDPDNGIQTSVMDYGIEICLDHSDTRLRQNMQNEPTLIGGVHVQLIPSCGMQIKTAGVAADKDGFVFNCDGQYALNGESKGQAVLNGVNCLYANHTYAQNKAYTAHTQLARVAQPAQGGDPTKKDTSATFQTLPDNDITIIDVTPLSQTDAYFAGGAGQIHIYGLNEPYILYPKSTEKTS